ncbi:MAG: hypothetical protein VW804_15135 [Verrucomicrobiota bacterium]
MNDWNIQSRSRICLQCETPFEDQAIYHSLLHAEGAELVREDLCHDCWHARKAAGQSDPTQKPAAYLSHWQGRFQAPPPPTPDAIGRDTAESLMRRLATEDHPEYRGALYILAVMLERKRILKVRDQFQRDQQRLFVYEHAKSGDVFTIAEPALHLEELEKIQRDVAMLMEHGLPQATDAASEANQSENPEQETDIQEPESSEVESSEAANTDPNDPQPASVL